MTTIKAIPTLYNGSLFRSRLEARWAAFLDLLKWDWDYEPIDLDGWAPDFSIRGYEEVIYAEVKPVSWKVEKGKYSSDVKLPLSTFGKAINHANEFRVLLLGERPILEGDNFYFGAFNYFPWGKPEGDEIYGNDFGNAVAQRSNNSITCGFCSDFMNYTDYISGRCDHSGGIRPESFLDLGPELWRKAGSIVQWRKP